MNIEYQIKFEFEAETNTISYQKALLLVEIVAKKKELQKKRDQYNYLYGKKRGIWRRSTMADEKRGWKIDQLAEAVRNMERRFNEM